MAGLKELSEIWKNIREVDLRPICDAATRQIALALVGEVGSGRHTLARQLRTDPGRAEAETDTPILFADLEGAESAAQSDLIILLLDVTQADCERQRKLAQGWYDAGKRVLIFYNKLDLLTDPEALRQSQRLPGEQVIYGSALDRQFLLDRFVPAARALLPDNPLALGRRFPLFRLTIARELIDETCLSNTVYALSTGVAEIIPVLDLPLNIADMVVLTKAQAFLVYRLGLLLGLSTRWQDHMAEFGSVIGGGFIWRQVARSLVGLIPVWGLIPKLAVAYAGTYVVGNVVLQWYLTGRHVSRAQLNGLYRQAFARGKHYAQIMLDKAPRIRLPHPRRTALPEGETRPARKWLPLRLGRRKKEPPEPVEEIVIEAQWADAETVPDEGLRSPQIEMIPEGKTCPACAKSSAVDAAFCQYCGTRFQT